MPVVPVSLRSEMSDSYLQYAASAYIRALPDVRDGLRAASRRVIWGAHTLGLTTNTYKKCARVDGHVTGSLSPHGSVYGTIVNLSECSLHSATVFTFQGNRGVYSDIAHLSEDNPAAARYTEIKLAPITRYILDSSELLEFIPNYDGSTIEPVTLAPAFPYLLTQTVTGIGVGYACNWRPFNLGELVKLTKKVISGTATQKDILYPDWPTGGVIEKSAQTQQTLESGQGTLWVRGKAQIEKLPYGKRNKLRECVVITELPPGVSAEKFCSDITAKADSYTSGLIGISDESSREGIRIVITPKTDAASLLKELFILSLLRVGVNLNQSAVHKGIPKLFTQTEAISEWLAHRKQAVQKRLNLQREQLEQTIGTTQAVVNFLSRLDEFNLLKLDLSKLQPLTQAEEQAIRRLSVDQLGQLDKFKQKLTELKQELSQLPSEPLEVILSELDEIAAKFSRPRSTTVAAVAATTSAATATNKPRPRTIETEIREQAAALGMQRKHMLAYLKGKKLKDMSLQAWQQHVQAWKEDQEFTTPSGRARRRTYKVSAQAAARQAGQIRQLNKLWKDKQLDGMTMANISKLLKKELKLIVDVTT